MGSLESFEDERTADELAGIQQLTVSELVAQAHQRGAFVDLPPLTDGSWRPDSTHNLLRWMGGLGGLYDLFTPTEKDNAVLTSNVQASLDVAACEAVEAWAKAKPGAAAAARRRSTSRGRSSRSRRSPTPPAGRRGLRER